MTSPSATAAAMVASINSDIAAVQARIAAIRETTGAQTSSSSTAGGDTATEFASALSNAGTTGTTGTSVSGSGTVTGSQVVADAEQYLGVPYVWGGESTSGMDCSGLVQKTYGDLGITLPRVAADQQKVGTAVSSLAQAQPGDLLFFGQPAYHVAIYLGNNKLIESPEPGKTVHITDVYQTPTSIRRIVSPGAVSSGLTGLQSASASTAGGKSAAQLTAAGLNSAVAAYAPQFAAAESQYQLPSGMLAAVAQQESGGNARAVSSAGAEGLMQLMPSTAAGMGVNAYDPSQAITAAAKILHHNLSEFGDSVPLALAAYNAGAGAVQQYGGIPPYSETQNYVRSITAMMSRGA
jgi:cell wall-associated NlpC family hydrolase